MANVSLALLTHSKARRYPETGSDELKIREILLLRLPDYPARCRIIWKLQKKSFADRQLIGVVSGLA